MPTPDKIQQAPDAADSATVLGGLQHYLGQPHPTEMPKALLSEATGIGRAHQAEMVDNSSAVSFEMDDERGEPHRCTMNVSAYVLLVCIKIVGQSVFLNRNSPNGRPYLKVLGRADKKAGIVFARVLLRVEEDEQVTYRDRRPLNLTFLNLKPTVREVKRGTLDWYGQALVYAPTLPDTLFPGTQTEKFEAAKSLLHRAMERVEAELGDLHASR